MDILAGMWVHSCIIPSLLFAVLIAREVQIRILTPALYSSSILGTYSTTGPGFDLALQHAGELFPQLKFTHEILDSKASDCRTWSDDLENQVAAAYYKTTPETLNRTRALTAVITGGDIIFLKAK